MKGIIMTSGGWNKQTRDEIREILFDKGYFLIDEYVKENSRKRKVIIENKQGYKYDVQYDNVLHQNLGIVDKRNPFSIHNISIWCYINKRSFRLYENNIYVNSKIDLNFICLLCNEIFSNCWNGVQQGEACPFCAGKEIGNKNNFEYLHENLLVLWDYNLNKENPYEILPNTHFSFWWKCPDCLTSWKTTPNHIIRGTRCPNCASSRGEKKIKKFLENNNILYVDQKRFDDCRDERKLPFDFGIPYNEGTWKCIEYHGVQHYEPTDFAGRGEKWAKEQFKELKKRDKIKAKFCKDNNIPLIIIPYWDYDNIEKILSETLL